MAEKEIVFFGKLIAGVASGVFVTESMLLIFLAAADGRPRRFILALSEK